MLIDNVFIGGVWVNSNLAGSNTSGTPLDLTLLIESLTGEAISDIYTLTVSAVAAGHGTITVTTSAPDNPYNNAATTGVALDGATEYREIIPGVVLVFKATAANGNTAQVSIGQYEGAIDAFGVGAGTPVFPTRHQVHNPDASAVTGAVATLASEAIQKKKVGAVFTLIDPYAPGATYKPLGGVSDQVNPYRAKITAIAGAGAGKTATLQVDGATLGADTVKDIETGLTQDSVGLKAITPAYLYLVISGPLTGLKFAIDPACAVNDTANVLIFPNRYIQITADIAGVADGTGWGVADVPLTQAGQSAGVIQSLGDAYYWTRFVVPAGASSESNPWQAWAFAKAVTSQGANWNG